MSNKEIMEKHAINSVIDWVEKNQRPLYLAGGGLAGLGGLFLLSDIFGIDFLEEPDSIKDLDKVVVKIPKKGINKKSNYINNEIDVEKELQFLNGVFKKASSIEYNISTDTPELPLATGTFTGPVGTAAMLGLGVPLGAYGIYKLIETFAKRKKRNEISEMLYDLTGPNIEKSSSHFDNYSDNYSRIWNRVPYSRDISNFAEGGIDAVKGIFDYGGSAVTGIKDYFSKGKYKDITRPAITGYAGLLGGAAGLGTLLGYFALKEYLNKDEEIDENIENINPQIVYEYEE